MPLQFLSNPLPLVRRLEAVGFRAWPASSIHYDGSWQVRLTAGHPSKRLNSIVPLDPSDHRDVEIRLEKAQRKFEAYGRPLVVRETPLAPPVLMTLLRETNWDAFEETIVMTCDLLDIVLPDTLDHLPSHDVGRYVDASLSVDGSDSALKPALAEVVSSIKPPSGLFVIEDPELGPVATTLCVQDNDLAGLMSLSVAPAFRRKGFGIEIVASALRWARTRSAKTAWLQVAASNDAALALYDGIGFREAYRYRYWRPQS
ncbi:MULTISPECIES: GNAT family N-acetyltransferase [Rhizobium]|uniref:GNAT family N-acetyltransferase n=1 Tax=Rhizobium rhododendri TaxID=2506430 RepID=A0ABY8IG92_9HYPH|nr:MULTISPECIES: GNAT family N-acetyltransferase [Rhizobium]MBZ5760964.1 GNAT family N-acetyltransferase [Rhizobium sp. VS19-DR96]MBZ5765252.1 GNAT family N-acetyltransferase [Rhizobium sp. VS19-DR129.2]MBZ5774785.1 GNAT family N-acetyltransferase [Rhizobium sp. VS19-DRK62.2]MBZ5784799.1 GNAT family N-acetyltransferase [Rhizobium sp. VS19-DR121]MBZ5801411.1 GNAT family N-acetyltransferase [Rhizobium sp. VS19-DR181]